MSRQNKKLSKKISDQELDALLSAEPDHALPEPPEGLLDRLLSDIPEDLSFEWADDAPESPAPPRPANDDSPRYWRWAVAASALFAVGLGSIWLTRWDSAPASRSESEIAAVSILEAPRATTADQTVAPAVIEKRDHRADDSLRSSAVETPEEPKEALSRQLEARARAVEKRSLEARGHEVRKQILGAAESPTRAPESPAPVGGNRAQARFIGGQDQPVAGDAEPRMEVVDEVVVTVEAPLIDVQKSTAAAAPAPRRIQTAPSPAPASPPPSEARERQRFQGHIDGLPTPGAVNDQAFEDNFFASVDTNPFIDVEDDPLATFGLDVDTGSYAVVRDYLRRGHLPPREAVRLEELVNYFDYRDPAPERGEGDFSLSVEGAPSLFAEGERYYLLRVGLKGREVLSRERPAAFLTFVVDVSGSMERGNRLGLVRQSLKLLLDHMEDQDRFALVVYGSRGRVLLEPTTDRQTIRRAIEQLRPEGSTNAGEGLRLAYDLAARHNREGEINRVILCSDGVANVGATSAESILELIRDSAQQGVELTTVGFGMGNYNDALMEQLADQGNGRYAYVDTLAEARKLFVEDLTGTLLTIAAEARAQVRFNPDVVSRYRLMGYENRDIADDRFRDDTVDAGEIGAGHTVTALFEVKARRNLKKRDLLATVDLRYASVENKKMVEQSVEIRGRDVAKTWKRAAPSLRLAGLVAETAEILRGSYWAREGDLREVHQRLKKVSVEFAGDGDVAELTTLVGIAADLQTMEN